MKGRKDKTKGGKPESDQEDSDSYGEEYNNIAG